MLIISHRRNSIELLKDVPRQYGIEIDIRSFGSKLIVEHDPFVDGVEFSKWMDHFQHKTLILNTKEEGLEQPLLEEMKSRKIDDFFFLDQSFPFMVKTAKTGESRSAVRFSEFESIDTCLSLAGLVQWVWVDCFTKFPLTKNAYNTLKNANFKLCLVSPELQGRSSVKEVEEIRSLIDTHGFAIDAVCTKTPEAWL